MTSSRRFYRKWKKYLSSMNRHGMKFTNSLTLEQVSIARVVAPFPQANWLLPAATTANLETPCVCSCHCCASARLQELNHWFCSENLRLSSGTAHGSDCQMTSTGSKLGSNMNSAAWPTSCKGLICSEILNKMCGVWIPLSPLKMPT